MSFLSKSAPILRQVATKPSPRLFSTAVVYHKSATETVKDGLKAVDRTVSDQIVKGIDAGVNAKDSAASTVGVNANKAEGEASATAGQAKGKAQELAGQAQGKASELAGQAKGKAYELKGKAQS